MIRFEDHAAVTAQDKWGEAIQAYLASIKFADVMVGRVLDALEKSQYAEKTVIVLWSDHGWHLGEKQHWRKYTLWEEATRVPLVFVVPEGVPGLPESTPSGTSPRPASLLDLYPTLIELSGLPERVELEGTSLVPLLKNPQAVWNRPVVTTHGRNNHAVRSERYR